jgi:hypothetical protein
MRRNALIAIVLALAAGAARLMWGARQPDSPKPTPDQRVHPARADLVIDGGRVYWADSAGVYWIDRHGGPVHKVADGQLEVTAMAIDADYVYWASEDVDGAGRIERVAKDGGEVVTVALVRSPRALAVDGNTLYFTSDRGVYGVAKATGALYPLAEEAAPPAWLALTRAWVVWVADGRVRAVDKQGGAPVVLRQFPQLCGLATDDDHVYWGDGHAIMRLASDGELTRVATTEICPKAIAATSTNVYWVDNVNRGGMGVVERTSLASGVVDAVGDIDGWAEPHQLVADDRAVFWPYQGGIHEAVGGSAAATLFAYP